MGYLVVWNMCFTLVFFEKVFFFLVVIVYRCQFEKVVIVSLYNCMNRMIVTCWFSLVAYEIVYFMLFNPLYWLFGIFLKSLVNLWGFLFIFFNLEFDWQIVGHFIIVRDVIFFVRIPNSEGRILEGIDLKGLNPLILLVIQSLKCGWAKSKCYLFRSL